MNAREFFDKVEESFKETEGSDPIGVGFFISDMEKLFDEWEATQSKE